MLIKKDVSENVAYHLKLFSWENRIGPFGNVDRTIQRSVNGIITNGEVFSYF
jgi:hypothetical protein